MSTVDFIVEYRVFKNLVDTKDSKIDSKSSVEHSKGSVIDS